MFVVFWMFMFFLNVSMLEFFELFIEFSCYKDTIP